MHSLFLDNNVVNGAKNWILRKQQKPSGCFPRVGEIIHKELKVRKIDLSEVDVGEERRREAGAVVAVLRGG